MPTLTPLNSTAASNFSAILNSGDPAILVEAVRASSWDRLSQLAAANTLDVQEATTTLNALESSNIQSEFDNMAQKLSPDGTTKLATTDGGATVALTLAMNTDLQSQLQSFGLSLPTQDRYTVSSITTDSAGNVLSSSADHLETSAEAAAIAKGTMGTVIDSGKTLATSSVNNPNGTTTVYTFDPGTKVAAASLADIQNLVPDAKQALTTRIQDGSTRIRAFSERLAQFQQLSSVQSQGLRDQEHARREKEHDSSRKDANDLDRLLVERHDRTLQDDRAAFGSPAPDRSDR